MNRILTAIPAWQAPQSPLATRARRGRLVAEPSIGPQDAFARDRERIVHSTAFRRLQYKTQVFVSHEGDHYRTRLTHTLEVAHVARGLARSLGLDEDLAEAVALAHDLGHAPFGHAGEDALDAAMREFGGFDHNRQTVRLVTLLERRHLGFDGLNLSWECLEGVIKHNGPVTAPSPEVEALDTMLDLGLRRQTGLEAQIAAIADDIAYASHDIDDGLRAGFFDLDDLATLPLLGDLVRDALARSGSSDGSRLAHLVTRALVAALLDDLLTETWRGIEASGVASEDDVRALAAPLVRFSPSCEAAKGALKSYLFQRMYRHYKVNRMTSKARRLVGDLFQLFIDEPNVLPPEWAAALPEDLAGRARLVADYIAGMTDRFAREEHKRLFDLTETRW